MLPLRLQQPLLWGCSAPTWADAYDPPGSYYNTATGTGATLKSQLHNIIDGHSYTSYNAARSILQITDQDPNDPNRMLLVYDRTSLNVSAINGGSIPGWDSGNSWNREHTWPKSHGVGSSGHDSSDLHQLRPSDPVINSQRGNLNFGGNFGQSYGEVSGMWYPGDTDAGMIARQQFYMAVRYDGFDSSTENLELVTGNPGPTNLLGDLNALVQWHYEAVPDDFERRRNQIIYDDYQENRNPFIDHPEYVWSVFMDQANDSQITISGGSILGQGATTRDINLGTLFVGEAVPAAQSVTLNKQGSDGTYYQVATAGLATTTLTQQRNAFSTGTTDSIAFSRGPRYRHQHRRFPLGHRDD